MLASYGLYEFESRSASTLTYPGRGCPWPSWTSVYVRGLTPLGLHVPQGRVVVAHVRPLAFDCRISVLSLDNYF